MAQDHTVHENRGDEKLYQEPVCLDLNPGPPPNKPVTKGALLSLLPFPCLYDGYLNSPCIVATYQRVNEIIQGDIQCLIHSKCSTISVARSGALAFGFVVEVGLFVFSLTKLPFVSWRGG